MLEQGIATRDYPAANYGMGRCRFHLALHVEPAVMGPATASDAPEVEALRALAARFEALRPQAPDGGEPSAAAKAAWLAKLGAPPDPPADAGPPAPFRPENLRSSADTDGRVGTGDVVDALGGPLFARLRTREAIHQLFPPDPIYDPLEDTLADLVNDPGFAAGFGIGTVKGVHRAGQDLAHSIPDTIVLIQKLTAELIRSRAPLEQLAGIVDDLARAPGRLADEFTTRWNAPGSYDRGSFRGEVTGYILAQLVILVATMGAGALAEVAGPYAQIIRAISAVTDPFALASELRLAATTTEALQVARAGRALAAADDAAGGARAAAHASADVTADGARAAPATTPSTEGTPAATLTAPGATGPARRPRILEPFAGDSLDSARDLQGRHPGAEIIAAEARYPPSAEDIAAFRAQGGEFLAERFAESLPPGSLDKIYVRYPMPHDKGVENTRYHLGRAIESELARPGADYTEVLSRLPRSMAAEIESVTNLGPHAIEKLRPGGTMEIVYWEKDIYNEIRALTGRPYADPVTGERFGVEISSPPRSIRRDSLPRSGMGVPEHVEIVTELTIRKVPAP